MKYFIISPGDVDATMNGPLKTVMRHSILSQYLLQQYPRDIMATQIRHSRMKIVQQLLIIKRTQLHFW